LDKEIKWKKIMGETIAMKIANVYSKKDNILLGYSMTHDGKSAAGRNYLTFEDEHDQIYKKKEAKVHDVSILDFKNRNITHYNDAADEGKLDQHK